MILLIGVAMWAMCAPAGFIVGELAREHWMDDKANHWLSYFCAACPPASAMLGMALILKQLDKESMKDD